MPKIVAAILAAGSSSRMGTPKQLLRMDAETLLERTISAALNSSCAQVVVILGANADAIQAEITVPEKVSISVNSLWQEGIASSVRCAVQFAVNLLPDADGLVLLTCDQPYVTTRVIDKLVQQGLAESILVSACSYDGTFGIPAFFRREVFDELCNLKGDSGAKVIIERHERNLSTIEFPDAAVDIDTMQDYQSIFAR